MVKMSIYTIAIDTFVPTLRSLSGVLDEGAQHAGGAKPDLKALVQARLAPDMYALERQVQLACDHAAGTIARLQGQEPPTFDNNEKTIDDLKARIARAIEYVQRVHESALDGAESSEIRIPIQGIDGEFEMNGLQFLRDWALPHFYFHVVTAYDILRHNGVDIGKRDYMSQVGGYIRQRGRRG